MHTVRPPAVAGSFYPLDPASLGREVARLLATAPHGAHNPVCPKALIVPHAGYVYSGATAALAYARLKPCASDIRKVVLLGPAHRIAARGLTWPNVDMLATPLGTVPVDIDSIQSLLALPQVTANAAVHAMEHSLEVHLPFLQMVLEDFTLVPLAVGDASAAEVAQVLDRVWGGPETLVVISSDLSHYLPYAQARSADHQTLQAILNLKPDLTPKQACGATPINGLLQVAQARGLHPEVLGMCNSGDTSCDRSRVVGYAAVVFAPANHVIH